MGTWRCFLTGSDVFYFSDPSWLFPLYRYLLLSLLGTSFNTGIPHQKPWESLDRKAGVHVYSGDRYERSVNEWSQFDFWSVTIPWHHTRCGWRNVNVDPVCVGRWCRALQYICKHMHFQLWGLSSHSITSIEYLYMYICMNRNKHRTLEISTPMTKTCLYWSLVFISSCILYTYMFIHSLSISKQFNDWVISSLIAPPILLILFYTGTKAWLISRRVNRRLATGSCSLVILCLCVLHMYFPIVEFW